MSTNGDDILVEYSLLDIRRITRGLMCPADSGEHKLALMAVTRLFGPATVSLFISLLVITALLMFVKSRNLEKEEIGDLSFTYRSSEKMKPAERQDVRDTIDDMVRHDMVNPPPAFDPPVSNPDPFMSGPELFITQAPPLPVGDNGPLRLKAPILKGYHENRGNPTLRKNAMEQFKAPKETEQRVLAALRWLKKKQDPDGSWKTASDVDPVAMTGLAALCFLAHGETPQQSAEFGPTLEKAIRYLMTVQKADGQFSPSSYTHAIVTYALAEAFALTRIMEVRESMEKGVDFLIQGQQTEGGFDYQYAKQARFDTSVAGWNIQALKAARVAGSRHPELAGAIEKSIRFLKTQAFAQNGSGFVYSGDAGTATEAGGRWTMTGVGTLGLQILGRRMDPEARRGLACLADLACEWSAQKDFKPSVYGWYYVTQVKFHQGEKAWEAWNNQFSQAYLDRQVREPDGCGFWPRGDHGGAVYATTLATLTLEVYYRYLPSYQMHEGAVSASAEDDVQVQVM